MNIDDEQRQYVFETGDVKPRELFTVGGTLWLMRFAEWRRQRKVK